MTKKGSWVGPKTPKPLQPRQTINPRPHGTGNCEVCHTVPCSCGGSYTHELRRIATVLEAMLKLFRQRRNF